jgi:hypothetical protein
VKHHLLTAAFLVGAIACYAASFNAGMIAFAATGLVFESVFWFRLFKRRTSPRRLAS